MALFRAFFMGSVMDICMCLFTDMYVCAGLWMLFHYSGQARWEKVILSSFFEGFLGLR
jgi:hypothetical protein